MPTFGVKCYVQGEWAGVEHEPTEAEDEWEAAVRICGQPLAKGGKPGQLRAVVWPTSKPGKRTPFITPPNVPNSS